MKQNKVKTILVSQPKPESDKSPYFSLAKKFRLRGLPTTIIIDKNGNEFARVIGEINFEDKKFVNFLRKINF